MGMMDYPIFSEQLRKGGVGEQYYLNCPSKNDEKYDKSAKAIVDTTITDHDIGEFKIPLCNYEIVDGPTNFGNDSTDTAGCCIAPITANQPDCAPGHDTGIDFSNSDASYNICNKFDIAEFRETPDGLIKFAMYICVSIIIMLIITFVGCSYEFWLEYGTNIDCLYYQSKCDNRSQRLDGKTSMIEYLFPNALNFFPYQPCLPCEKFPKGTNPSKHYELQSGGKADGNGKTNEFISNFTVNYIENKKCITMHNEGDNCERPFPYNIPDYVSESPSYYLRTIFKAVAFFYAIPILILRKVFNFIFSGISTKYQQYISNSVLPKALCFLLLSGLLAPTLAMLGIQIPAITIFSNPMTFFGMLVMMAEIIGFIGFLITWVFVLRPSNAISLLSSNLVKDALRGKKQLNKTNKLDKEIFYNVITKFYPNESLNPDKADKYIIDYYSLFTYKHWWPVYDLLFKEKKITKGILNLLGNVLILPVCYLILLICVISISMIMYTISATLFAITTFFKMFFYPISNQLEFYNIIKSHSGILTIFFCILVFISGTTTLASETRNIMAFVLALIILAKIIQSSRS